MFYGIIVSLFFKEFARRICDLCIYKLFFCCCREGFVFTESLNSLPSFLTELGEAQILDWISRREIVTKTVTKSSMGHLERGFTLLCKRRKRSCNVALDVPQARNKIKHSMCWLHKTLKVLYPNFTAFSGSEAWGEKFSDDFAVNYKNHSTFVEFNHSDQGKGNCSNFLE